MCSLRSRWEWVGYAGQVYMLVLSWKQTVVGAHKVWWSRKSLVVPYEGKKQTRRKRNQLYNSPAEARSLMFLRYYVLIGSYYYCNWWVN